VKSELGVPDLVVEVVGAGQQNVCRLHREGDQKDFLSTKFNTKD